MFSYCLKLKMRKETGTNSKSHGLVVFLKASKSMLNVARKQARMRYISTTLSYSVMLPNRSSTPLGKNILCSLCGRKRSVMCNVPEDHQSKKRAIDHASPKTTLTPNART